jgi:chemotaxis protein MotA
MGVLRIVFSNFTWVDALIIVLAAANGVVCALARRQALRLYNTMHQSKYMPSWRGSRAPLADSVRAVDEEGIIEMRDRALTFYTVFVNITAIFPLLGIFGTVWSLIPMVENLADMQQNFFAALTSTFWGLVFAIAFKLLDGFLLSAKMDDNEKSVALYLERAPERHEEQEAALR